MTPASCILTVSKKDGKEVTSKAAPPSLVAYFKKNGEVTERIEIARVLEYFQGAEKESSSFLFNDNYDYNSDPDFLNDHRDWTFLEAKNPNQLSKYGVLPLRKQNTQKEVLGISVSQSATTFVLHPVEESDSKEIISRKYKILPIDINIHTEGLYDRFDPVRLEEEDRKANEGKKLYFGRNRKLELWEAFEKKRVFEVSLGILKYNIYRGGPVVFANDLSEPKVIGMIYSLKNNDSESLENTTRTGEIQWFPGTFK